MMMVHERFSFLISDAMYLLAGTMLEFRSTVSLTVLFIVYNKVVYVCMYMCTCCNESSVIIMYVCCAK